MFCVPEFIFGGIEGVESRFHVLRSRTHFRRYRVCQVPFSYFALPDMFSAVSKTSGPVFMFCSLGLIFGGTDDVGSRFHVLRSQTRFWHYRGRHVPFSGFVLPDSFSVVPRASSLIFIFCAPGLVFGGTEGVGSCFHVLRSQTLFQRYRGRWVSFSHFARSDSFRRYRGPRVSFSSFALPDAFSAVLGASGLIFLFYVPGIIFGGNEGVGCHFLVWCARTHFRRYRVQLVPF
jgi:hypothetical protein